MSRVTLRGRGPGRYVGSTNLRQGDSAFARLEFEITPHVSESGSANYRTVDPLHMPADLHIYAGSPTRRFSISDIKLPARTTEEADRKLRMINLIRGWRMPYFGSGNAGRSSGSPPDVLLLSAYGQGNIHNVPVVITSYNIDYPNDTDFVLATGGARVPIMSSMTIELQEVHSMREINSFDLGKYKQGQLTNW